MSVVSKEVLLLKSKTDDENDKYESLLKENGFTVKYLQVLEFEYKNLTELEEKLKTPDAYSGLIFTSPRAVTATKICLDDTNLDKKWVEKENFVVGESTFELVLKELHLECKGKETGNAENLANLITKNKYTKPFLFPCGNLKLDILSKHLNEHYIRLDEIVVYETVKSTHLYTEFNHLTACYSQFPEYIVYFSPSGVRFSADIIKSWPCLDDIKIIAMGPSTEKTLKEEQFTIHSVALHPTSTELLNILLNSGT